MASVAGGLLVGTGLFFVLGELDSYDQRWIGLLISLLFTVLGVILSRIGRSTRSAAAGAHPQRPLWASTGVKDASFNPAMYVSQPPLAGTTFS